MPVQSTDMQGMCDRRTRSRRATSASAASARSRCATTTARRRRRAAQAPDPGRPAVRSGATPTSCRSSAPPRSRAAGGLHAAAARRPAGRARSACGEVWVKNDAANPTHSFKDRVVVGRARQGAASSASTTVACASTGNLANAVAAHAAAAGLESYVFIPSDLEEQKILATGVYGTQLVGRARQLRRRQPPLHRALGRARAGRS